MAEINIEEQQVFIPERYLTHMELLVETKEHGRGIMVKAAEINKEITSGRVHGNVVIDRAAVYVTKEVSATPVLDKKGFKI